MLIPPGLDPSRISRYAALVIVVLGLIVSFGFASYYGGYQKALTEAAEQKLKATQEAQKQMDALRAKLAETEARATQAYADSIKALQAKEKIHVQKVPVYITSDDDSRCVIPDGFGLLWNDALRDSDAPGGADASTHVNQHAKPKAKQGKGHPQRCC